jgi:hypothetical protein
MANVYEWKGIIVQISWGGGTTDFMSKEFMYEIVVTRVGYRQKTVKIVSSTEEEAKMLAIEDDGDFSSEHSYEYTTAVSSRRRVRKESSL